DRRAARPVGLHSLVRRPHGSRGGPPVRDHADRRFLGCEVREERALAALAGRTLEHARRAASGRLCFDAERPGRRAAQVHPEAALAADLRADLRRLGGVVRAGGRQGNGEEEDDRAHARLLCWCGRPGVPPMCTPFGASHAGLPGPCRPGARLPDPCRQCPRPAGRSAGKHRRHCAPATSVPTRPAPGGPAPALPARDGTARSMPPRATAGTAPQKPPQAHQVSPCPRPRPRPRPGPPYRTSPGSERSPDATSNTSVTHSNGSCTLALTRSAAVTPSYSNVSGKPTERSGTATRISDSVNCGG